MFSVHEVTVEVAHEEVLARLTHLINWGSLHGISDAAHQGGLDLLMRVGPFGDLPGLSKLVRVRALVPVRHGAATSVSLRWEATGVTGELFPVLDADLTVLRTEDRRCQLRLMGSYRPPLGRVGAALDHAIMRRVADATIRSLLERVAAAVSTPLPDVQFGGTSMASFEATPEPGAP